MERNFLGLLTVKEENTDVTVDSVQGREPGMQWSFSNYTSGPSQYLSFRASQEAKPRKNFYDQLDSNLKSCANGTQKVMVLDKSAGTNYPISAYPLQHINSHPIGRSHELRMFPSSNQPKESSTGTVSPPPVVPSHISPIAISPQQLEGVPVLPPAWNPPTSGSLIGSTDLRNGGEQHGGGLAQLTIFYAGSVNVFNDVSPEKAQAIMLLAGNGASIAHHKTIPATEVSGAFSMPVNDEGSNGNRTCSPAFLSLPGVVSVSSIAVSSSQGNPICNLELATVKPVGPLQSPVITRQEPQTPRAAHSLASSSTPLFSSVALPQARKASLARFLEKRKERATSTSPYPASKKSPESSISKVSDD